MRLDSNGLTMAKELRARHSQAAKANAKKRSSFDLESSGNQETDECKSPTIQRLETSPSHDRKAVRPVQVHLSRVSRSILFRDWDSVAKRQCLYKLPAEIPVKAILNRFLETQPSDMYRFRSYIVQL